MRFERSAAHLLIGLVFAFGVVIASALYWGVLGSDEALTSPFNYRQRDTLAALQRGMIIDRNGQTLVESISAESNIWLRITRDSSLPSITGYSSLTYGTGGAEAAYNTLLTGSTTPESFARQVDRDILHRPQRGSDIQLTLDLNIQKAAVEALNGRTGAVIVMDATTGALLAIASSPTINPATLDSQWETLIERTDNPFFNRALQSEYQPGGVLQPVLLAGWLIAGHTADDALILSTNLADAVTIGEATLGCIKTPPPTETVTVSQALLNGCPAGFSALIDTLGEKATTELMTLFGANKHIELNGFTLPAPAPSTATPSTDWRADALGQGMIRLSPLDMAVITAGIANDGNAPTPYLLQATRPSDTEAWVTVPHIQQTQPITTVQTAQTIQTLLRESVKSGTAIGSAQNGLVLGAHLSQAISGEQTLMWFTGFVQLEPHHHLVAVILWEGESPADELAEAGGTLLRAAADATMTE